MAVKKTIKVSTVAPPIHVYVDFCYIRGIHSNVNAVHHNLEMVKPALLFLTETKVFNPGNTKYLHYPVNRLEHHFLPQAGVFLYVKEHMCYQRLDSLEHRDQSVMQVRVDSGSSSRIYACLYR